MVWQCHALHAITTWEECCMKHTTNTIRGNKVAWHPVKATVPFAKINYSYHSIIITGKISQSLQKKKILCTQTLELKMRDSTTFDCRLKNISCQDDPGVYQRCCILGTLIRNNLVLKKYNLSTCEAVWGQLDLHYWKQFRDKMIKFLKSVRCCIHLNFNYAQFYAGTTFLNEW